MDAVVARLVRVRHAVRVVVVRKRLGVDEVVESSVVALFAAPSNDARWAKKRQASPESDSADAFTRDGPSRWTAPYYVPVVSSPIQDVYVGRARELALLDEVVACARAGRGALVWITGEPGIGKSRLADEVARRVEASGWTVTWGRSWEGSGTPAFWPWMQLLRRLAAQPALRACFADPRCRRLLDDGPPIDAERDGPTPIERGDPEQARFRMFDAVAQALSAAAARSPLLLVLDDVHAADPSSLALLRFVARNLHGTPVVVLATARDVAFAPSSAPAEPSPSAPRDGPTGPPSSSPPASDVPALLAQIAREAKHVPLARLSLADLAAWIDDAHAATTAEALFAASEGNPLFVHELLAAARARPGLAPTTTQLPHGIREAVRAHLALLSPRALRLVEDASVLGREPAAQPWTPTGGPADPEALDEAVRAGVLQDVGAGRLRFAHVLLRDELYGALPDGRRRALHRAVAARAADVAVAAHHAVLGVRTGDAPTQTTRAEAEAEAAEALARVRAAMRDATLRLAHVDAAELGARAIAALDGHVDPRDVCALRVEIAEALVLAGDLPGGQAEGERAAAAAQRLGLPDLLARAALVRAAELTFSGDAGVVAWLRAALQALPDVDSTHRALVMGRLCAALNNVVGTNDERRRLRDASVAMARRLGDEQALLTTLHAASGTFADDMNPRERFALYRETVELAERLGIVARVAPLLSWLVASWVDLGEPAGARAAADRAEALLAPYPQTHFWWRVPLTRAMLASVAGRFDEADRLSREVLAGAQEQRLFEAVMMAVVFRGTFAYVRGDDGAQPDLVPMILDAFSRAPTSDVFRAIVDAAVGDVARVRGSFALLRAMDVRQVTGASSLGWCCIRAGLVDDAELFYGLAEQQPLRTRFAWSPGGFGTMGPSDLLKGGLAAMTGRRDEAAACYARALVVAREAESPPFMAQVELAWAELLRDDDRAAASTHARAALAHARSVGMDVVAARAAALVGRVAGATVVESQRAAALTTMANAATAPTAATAAPVVVLVREGETWSLRCDGRVLRLKDAKGLRYLEALVQQPHVPLHALELSGIDEVADAGPVLDDAAKHAYRARAAALRDDIDGADPARAERARKELDALGEELARAFGLGGRARRAGSAAERARINVQRRLKDALRRIGEQDAALGRHFELSVKTGLLCMYAPTWPAR